MKLYHIPGSRSCRVRWLLEELELEHEVVTLSLTDGSLRTEGYLEKNPLGRVPTLEDGGAPFYESGAIVQYLLERDAKGRLAPPIGDPDRARFLQWSHWGEATLLPPIVTLNSHRFVLPESDRSEKAVSVAQRQLVRIFGVLGQAVEGRRYLVGDTFTAADIMVGYGVTLAKWVGELPVEHAAVHGWLEGLAERPAYQRSFAGGFG